MGHIEVLAAYKHSEQRKVVWGDMDAMQHVNNTKYFYYCESARLAFLRAVFPEIESKQPKGTNVGIALAETGCRFKASLTYPDDLMIATAVTEIEETQFSMQHAIYSQKLGFVAAEATARMVYYDFVNRKRASIDEKMLEVLEHYSL